MLIMSLHVVLTILLVLAGLSIFLCKNPIHSVFFLILCFCIAAGILFSLQIDFVGLLFILVYVGAIAVLFLFVVMMLDIKQDEEDLDDLLMLYSAVLIPVYLVVSTTMRGAFFDNTDGDALPQLLLIARIDEIPNIAILGQALYNNYTGVFILAGFILLIALIGAICLTLDYRKTEKARTLAMSQVSRKNKIIKF